MEIEQSNKPSADVANRKAILAALDKLGSLTVAEDTLTFEGSRFVLPASLAGDIQGAVDYLDSYRRQQEETYEYSRTYPFRPFDGAAAFDRTMKRLFGSTGIGQATYSMFGGKQAPRLRTITVGPGGQTLQVPWGQVAFSPLDAVFTTGADRDENGYVFQLSVEAPRKHRQRIEGFFDAVAEELRTGSIYRGQAINGDPQEPAFLDLSGIDPSRVIYAADVMTQLDANLWSLLDHSDVMRELKIPLKRAVLVEGPYGTGKTLAGALTALRAVANGWTYILCRPGRDDLMTTLKTAELYAPAVVWFEDIDTVGGQDGGQMFVSKLLDALDGVSAKGVEVVAGFTTNHVDQLQKGLLRPGRIDTVIHIGELDAAGIEHLVKVTVPAHLLSSTVDYGKVASAFTGYVPAFAKEAIDRAMRYSIARNHGRPDQVSTEDLVNAGQGLREQLRLMDGAAEGDRGRTIDDHITDLVSGVIGRSFIMDSYVESNDPMVVGEVNATTQGANGTR